MREQVTPENPGTLDPEMEKMREMKTRIQEVKGKIAKQKEADTHANPPRSMAALFITSRPKSLFEECTPLNQALAKNSPENHREPASFVCPNCSLLIPSNTISDDGPSCSRCEWKWKYTEPISDLEKQLEADTKAYIQARQAFERRQEESKQVLERMRREKERLQTEGQERLNKELEEQKILHKRREESFWMLLTYEKESRKIRQRKTTSNLRNAAQKCARQRKIDHSSPPEATAACLLDSTASFSEASPDEDLLTDNSMRQLASSNSNDSHVDEASPPWTCPQCTYTNPNSEVKNGSLLVCFVCECLYDRTATQALAKPATVTHESSTPAQAQDVDKPATDTHKSSVPDQTQVEGKPATDAHKSSNPKPAKVSQKPSESVKHKPTTTAPATDTNKKSTAESGENKKKSSPEQGLSQANEASALQAQTKRAGNASKESSTPAQAQHVDKPATDTHKSSVPDQAQVEGKPATDAHKPSHPKPAKVSQKPSESVKHKSTTAPATDTNKKSTAKSGKNKKKSSPEQGLSQANEASALQAQTAGNASEAEDTGNSKTEMLESTLDLDNPEDVEEEIVKIDQKIQKLETRISTLHQQIRNGEINAHAGLMELGDLMKTQGDLRHRIRELQIELLNDEE
eukprot:g37328.t1